MIFIYDILLTIFTPLIKLMSGMKIKFLQRNKDVTDSVYYQVRDKIEIGTVFLTTTHWEITNIFNPCEYKHGALYVGRIFGDEVCYVIEATRLGVVFTPLSEFMTSKDIVVGLKPNFIRKIDTFVEDLSEAGKAFEGTPYDYLFKKGAKAFYCFELVVAMFNRAYPEIRFKCKDIVKGKKIFDHDTFLDEDFFEVSFDTRNYL